MAIIHQDQGDKSLALTKEVNLAIPSSAPSAEEIRESWSLEVHSDPWATFINISLMISHGNLICQRMMIPAPPNKGDKVICWYTGFTFRLLYNNMSLLSLLRFLRDSHFKCSRMPVILPHSYSFLRGPKQNRYIPGLFRAHLESLDPRGPKQNRYIPGLGAPVLYMLHLLPLVDKRIDFVSGSQESN